MLKEERVIEMIKNRSNAMKVTLIVSRLILFTINISLLGASWYAIFLVNVYQDLITNYLAAHFSWLSYVAPFIPSIVLTLINTLIPLITSWIIYLERWDYASTVTNNLIWRNFFSKEINLIIFFFLNINMIIPISALKKVNQVVTFDSKTYPCVEVQISIAFLKQIATEFVIYLIKHPVKFFMFWLLGKTRNSCRSADSKEPKAQTKIELDISEVRIGFNNRLVCRVVIVFADSSMDNASLMSCATSCMSNHPIHTLSLHLMVSADVLLCKERGGSVQ